jgi:hypothetical protein
VTVSNVRTGIDRSIRGFPWGEQLYSFGLTGQDRQYRVIDGELDLAYDEAGTELPMREFIARHPGVTPTARGHFSARVAAFGDVNRDGVEDAVVVLTRSHDSGHRESFAWVYEVGPYGPVVFAGIPGGRGIEDVAIAYPGEIRISHRDRDRAALVRETWRWTGRVLTRDHAATVVAVVE